MSYSGKDYAFLETVAAVDAGANIFRTIRASLTPFGFGAWILDATQSGL